MLRAILHHPAHEWPEAEAEDSVTLDYDSRHRRRLKLVSDSGQPVLLDLERAVAMGHGDGLRTTTGQWIRVQAAPEPLVQARAPDALTMLRLAWHIGNRHIAAAISADAILIRPDPVIEAMLRDNGATLTRLTAPFQPIRGAYHSHHVVHGGDHGANHDAGHGAVHGADHVHGHGHGAGHSHGLGGHVHSHGDDHDHDHDHDHSHRHDDVLTGVRNPVRGGGPGDDR